jgi:VanZ family protein
LTLGWTCAILFLTLKPGDGSGIEIPIPHLDKLVHFGLFFIEGYFLSASRLFEKRRIFFPLLIGLVLGSLTEYLQIFIPGRSGDLFDLLADMIGVMCGILVYSFVKRK